jgi:hypothetical protein
MRAEMTVAAVAGAADVIAIHRAAARAVRDRRRRRTAP